MQFCIRHFFAFSRESTPFVNAATAVFLPRGSRLRETANSRPPVDNAKLRQFCIRHFFVISRESAPSMRRQPYSCRGDSRLRETANSRHCRQRKVAARLHSSFCISLRRRGYINSAENHIFGRCFAYAQHDSTFCPYSNLRNRHATTIRRLTLTRLKLAFSN